MKVKRCKRATPSLCFSAIVVAALGVQVAGLPVFAESLPTETPGALLIDTSAWDDLSRQVVPRVVENSLDMGTVLRYTRSASCTVDVAIKTPQISMPELGNFVVPAGPPSTARATLSWEDANDDGTLSEEEVKVETGYTSDIMMKMAAERIEKGLRNLVVLNVVNLLPQSSVKTERKGEEYEITVNPKEGPPVPMRLTVSGDFRITGTEFRTMGAMDTKATLKHVQKAGKWLLTEIETSTAAGTPQASSETWNIEFGTDAGIPLLSKVGVVSTSSTGSGVLRTQQEYAFSNWRVVKRSQPVGFVTAVVEAVEPVEEPGRTTPRVGPQVPSPVNVLRTEQANKLARDTIVSVCGAYYDLGTAGVTRYDAAFALQLDGRTVGNFALKWEAFGGVSIEPEQGQPEEIQGLAGAVGRRVANVVSGGPLSGYSFAADVYAGRSANETMIDATKHAAVLDPTIKSDVLFIPPDLRRIRITRTMNDGRTSETLYAGEEFEGKLFVGSAKDTVTEPGRPPRSTEYTWSYTKKYGPPFVRRVQWSGTAGGRTGEWTVLLSNVTFQKEVARIKIDAGLTERAELAKKVKVPHTEEASKLAQQVIQSVEKSYFSLLYSTNVSGVEASYAFTDLLGHRAKVEVKWSRQNERAMTAGVKGDLEAGQEKVVNAMAANDLLRTLVLGPLRGARGAGVYAVQSGNEYVLDASDWAKQTAVSYSIQLFFVSTDLSEVRMLVMFKDDLEETRFEGDKEDGMFYVRRSSVTMQQPGAKQSKLDYNWTYTRRKGNVFVERLELPGALNKFTLELQDVTFEEGGAPVVTPTEPVLTEEPLVTVPTVEEARKLAQEANVPRTEEAKQLASQVLSSVRKKYHSVFHSTNVSGFQVTASVKKDDYDVGNIKITWKRDDPEKPDAEAEKKVEDPVATLIHGMAMELAAIDALMPFVLGPLRSARAPDGYAVKSGGLYIIDLTVGAQNENLKAHVACIALDFSRVQEISFYRDGDVLEWIFDGEAADGTLLISSATQPISPPLGGGHEPTKFSWTYTRKGGGIFIKKAQVDQPLMGNVMHWTIEFSDAILQGGQAVQEIPEDIQRAREQALKDLDEQMQKALEEAMRLELEKIGEEGP